MWNGDSWRARSASSHVPNWASAVARANIGETCSYPREDAASHIVAEAAADTACSASSCPSVTDCQIQICVSAMEVVALNLEGAHFVQNLDVPADAAAEAGLTE